MSSKKNAAIILLGMGEASAAEVLKTFDHKEVEIIIESMNSIGDVTEGEVIAALNAFFNETKTVSGISASSNTYLHNSLVNAVGSHKAESMFDKDESNSTAKYTGLELIKWQPTYQIIDALHEEHPQIITVALMCLDSDKAAEVLKSLPTDIRKDVVKRITNCGTVSQFAMQTLSDYLESQFTTSEKFNKITADGVDLAVNIISKLDVETESEILTHIQAEDEAMSTQLADKLFPFEKLVEMDAKSLQTLITEANQDDMVLALKGADEDIKTQFFDNMSSKTAELLQDDMDATGPVKLSDVFDAQKRIIVFAKELSKDEKIFIPSGKDETQMV